MPTPNVYYKVCAEYDALKQKAENLADAVMMFIHIYEGGICDPLPDLEAMKQRLREYYEEDDHAKN